MIITVLISFL